MRDVGFPHARQYVPSIFHRVLDYTYGILEYPDFLSQQDFEEYIGSYATHFDLIKDIVFNATLKQVARNENTNKWRLHLLVNGEPQFEEYDKVAFCHGYQSITNMPVFDGVEKFEGVVMHTQQFRM